MRDAFRNVCIDQTANLYEDTRRHYLFFKKIFDAITIIIISIIIIMPLASAQGNTLSGQFEVADFISDIGNVDLSLVTNPIFNQNGVAVWQITPDANYPYLDQLKFYAKMDKNNNQLSVLLAGENQDKSLRGMIPSLYKLQGQDASLSSRSDPIHYCYPYDNSKTLIYSLLKDAFSEIKSNSVIGPNAQLGGNPKYKSSFTDKVSIFGYYITSTNFNNDNFCYHNWPWGTGTDECIYGKGSYICDYSTGTVQVAFDFDLVNPKSYYIFGFINNDNGEETQYTYNNDVWLHQIDYGPGSTSNEKFADSDFPTQIILNARKTWSSNRLMTWMAINADSVSATGHITGDGATHVDRDEDPDVLQSIALEKGSIEWPLNLNPVLNIEWQKCLGGSNEDRAYSVQQTNDGGYILVGYAHSNDGDVSGNHGISDIWVVKLNDIGIIQWQRCLGGSSGELSRSYCIQQTSDDGYIVAGSTSSNDGNVSGNHGSGDFWVVKLNDSGSIEWQKCLGGSGLEQANAIRLALDGGYILAGYTESNDGDVSGNHGGNGDFWVVKLNYTGVIEWQKCLGGSGQDIANDIQLTPDGGYIVTGITSSSDGDITGFHGVLDSWTAKLDANGTVLWQNCLGGSGSDGSHSIWLTSDGGYVLGGLNGGGSLWVAKLNSSGSMQWQKFLGGSGAEEAHSIQQTSEGGYIVAGYTSSNDGDASGNHGGYETYDAWVIKLNSSGNIRWQKCLGGSGEDIANDIQQISDDNYILAGYTTSNDGDVKGNHGSYDYWIAKLNVEATDIKVSITAEPTKSTPGSNINFEIRVVNAGDDNVSLSKITDILPEGMSYVSDDNSGQVSGKTVTWNNPEVINPGDSKSIKLIAKVDPGIFGQLINNVNVTAVSSSGEDIFYFDSAAIASLNPGDANLSITKTTDKDWIAPGDDISFTIKAVNIGNSLLNAVNIVDTLPSGMSYVSDNSDGNPSGQTIQWSIGTLNPGDSKSIQLLARANPGASTQLINSVTATGISSSGNTVTNSATSAIFVKPSIPDLNITSEDITFSDPAPELGDTIKVTAAIHNDGGSVVNNVPVFFYDGDPDSTGKLMIEKIIPSIPDDGIVAVDAFWNISLANARIYIDVDPNDSINEVNKQNNNASAGIKKATKLDTFEYDANGNMINDKGLKYIYNNGNQLSIILNKMTGATVAEYFYDSNGQRIKKIEDGITTYYIGDYVETKVVTGVDKTTSYYFANSNHIARKDSNGEIYYYHNDHLGSTNVITNKTCGLSGSIEYYPYGLITKLIGNAGGHQYTGKELDAESALYYYGARYYNPKLARFMEPDPIVQNAINPQSLNRYSYVLNNPMKKIDPTGYISTGGVGVGIGMVVSGALLVIGAGAATTAAAGLALCVGATTLLVAPFVIIASVLAPDETNEDMTYAMTILAGAIDPVIAPIQVMAAPFGRDALEFTTKAAGLIKSAARIESDNLPSQLNFLMKAASAFGQKAFEVKYTEAMPTPTGTSSTTTTTIVPSTTTPTTTSTTTSTTTTTTVPSTISSTTTSTSIFDLLSRLFLGAQLVSWGSMV